MMKKQLLFILLFIFMCLCFSFVPMHNTVSFYDAATNERIAFAPMKQNQTFSIQYTHSIHLSLVEETYEATETNDIRQIQLMYEDFGIGMPSQAEGEERFVQENGKYYIKNMNRIFPEIVLRVGEVAANHKLIIEDKEMPMSSFTAPGSVLRIQLTKLNRWELWKGVNVYD